ncbi:MAG: hypothetical protein MZV70_16155 [Desulfobacterales bacterium]|nr:hypothetical protein [Desulfobacterales bacterium]
MQKLEKLIDRIIRRVNINLRDQEFDAGPFLRPCIPLQEAVPVLCLLRGHRPPSPAFPLQPFQPGRELFPGQMPGGRVGPLQKRHPGGRAQVQGRQLSATAGSA